MLKGNKPKPLGFVALPVSIGHKLRNYRLELGLLQKDIAELLDVSEDAVTYWENGRANPSQQNLKKIEQLLKKAGN